jgi:hypothetical protein
VKATGGRELWDTDDISAKILIGDLRREGAQEVYAAGIYNDGDAETALYFILKMSDDTDRRASVFARANMYLRAVGQEPLEGCGKYCWMPIGRPHMLQ